MNKRALLISCLVAPWLLACGLIPDCRACSRVPAPPPPPTVGVPPALLGGRTLVEVLPADIDAVMGVDLLAMRASPLLRRILSESPQTPIPEFVLKCGFNPLQRVRHASVGLRFAGSREPDVVLLVDSDISEQELFRCAVGNGETPTPGPALGTRHVWQTRDGQNILVFASPSLMVAGTRSLVERTLEVIDSAFPSTGANRRLSAALASLGPSGTVRTAVTLSDRVRHAMDIEHAPDMEGVEAFALGASIGTDLSGTVTFTYDSPERAAAAALLMTPAMADRSRALGFPEGEVRFGISLQGADVMFMFSADDDAVLAALSRGGGR